MLKKKMKKNHTELSLFQYKSIYSTNKQNINININICLQYCYFVYLKRLTSDIERCKNIF